MPVEAFLDVDVFRGLNADEIGDIMLGAERLEVSTGTTICREGDPADRFYVMERGSCEVRRRVGDREVVVAELAGKVAFGEMGIVMEQSRNATIITTSACTLWCVKRRRFSFMCQRGGQDMMKLALNMVRILCRRLDTLDLEFAELVRRYETSEPVRTEDLANFKQKLYSEWSF